MGFGSGLLIGLAIGLALGVIFHLTISSLWHKSLAEVKEEIAKVHAKL